MNTHIPFSAFSALTPLGKRAVLLFVAIAAIAIVLIPVESRRVRGQTTNAKASPPSSPDPHKAAPEPSVELTASQLETIKIEPVGTYMFPVEDDTVGSIDFDEDLSVLVFPPYQGTIIDTFVEIGNDVTKGQPLYTIKSPDLIQAESNLIAAAAAFELTDKELKRATSLNGTNVGVSERELEQATSDERTADGALRAARDAVLVFGKTDSEIDQMIASRKTDPALVVHSPISGKITARDAQPGFFVQPGTAPAPYSVADVTVKWMLASVGEADIPGFHLGEPVDAKVLAFPNRIFTGKVSKIYATADPNTHRVTVRTDISDPKDELLPGMLANFVVRVQSAAAAVAIPENGVVREGDGTYTAWVTTDRRHFSQRIVKPGLRRDGQVEILDGLKRGELAVSDGAVFLSNMLEAPPSD